MGLLGLGIGMALAGQLGLRLNNRALLKDRPEELSALLRPYCQIATPDGDGPFPMALLASGCDGPKDNLDTWRVALNGAGWATMIVDSHSPRGFEDDPVWRLICSGALLPGRARAGDLAVALADARQLAFVDASRLALIGASHGGWAVLDLLALAVAGRVPENLTNWPDAPGGDALAGVQAMAVFYPYCGRASYAARRGWQRDIPMLMILVEDDQIVDEQECNSLAKRQSQGNHSIIVKQFSNVTHGFDQKIKSHFSSLRYDNFKTEKLVKILVQYLSKTADP